MIKVTVVYSPEARVVHECELQLPDGATVADALRDCGWDMPNGVTFGIWNHKATPEQVLRDHDRVEIYRPLTVDPKVARRERFERQGKRGAGLFARPKVSKE